MPSLDALRATLQACLRQPNGAAEAKTVLTALCKDHGRLAGAATWLAWAHETGPESTWMPVIGGLPPKAAMLLLGAAVREPAPSPGLTNALWHAVGDTQAVMLAVREDDALVFDQAFARYKGQAGVQAVLRQGLNIAIDRQDATWASRLVKCCEPTNFHAQRLGQQDVAPDSPLLAVFAQRAEGLPFRTLSNNFLFPACHMAIVHNKPGVFIWVRDFCRARDEAWMAEHPRSSKCHQHVEAWAKQVLPALAQNNRVEWLEDVVRWVDPNTNNGEALRLAIEQKHEAIAGHLAKVTDLDAVMEFWGKQEKWPLMDHLARWGSELQRLAWDDRYGDHLVQLRAEMRAAVARHQAPKRSGSRPRV